jgi:hypothetical protein
MNAAYTQRARTARRTADSTIDWLRLFDFVYLRCASVRKASALLSVGLGGCVGAGSRQTGVSIVRPEKRRCDDRAETAETAILHAESNGATNCRQYDRLASPVSQSLGSPVCRSGARRPRWVSTDKSVCRTSAVAPGIDDRAETAETAILHAQSNGATDGWQYDGHSLPIWGAAFTLGLDRQECLSYFRGCRGKSAWVGSK